MYTLEDSQPYPHTTAMPLTEAGTAMPLWKILIVDAAPEHRASIRSALTEAGFDVVEAETGEQAVHYIKSGHRPFIDAVICDLCISINDMEPMAYFRCELPSIPVLAIADTHCVYRASKLFKKGVMDYLSRPFDMKRLIDVVMGICQHASAVKYELSTAAGRDGGSER